MTRHMPSARTIARWDLIDTALWLRDEPPAERDELTDDLPWEAEAAADVILDRRCRAQGRETVDVTALRP